MKLSPLLSIALVALCSTYFCGKSTGSPQTSTSIPVCDYCRVSITGPAPVIIKVVPHSKPVIDSGKIIDYVCRHTHPNDIVLKVDSSAVAGKGLRVIPPVMLYTSYLDAVTNEGSGQIYVTGVYGPQFYAANKSNGSITASGQATKIIVNNSGSGVVDLGKLAAQDGNVVVNRNGRVDLNLSRTLKASIETSDGSVYYSGAAKLDKTSVANGRVHHKK